MIVITGSAHAGVGRRSGSAEMRVGAVVIAHLPCPQLRGLSSPGRFFGSNRLETAQTGEHP
jgi:hypothetical protein